MLPYEEIGFYTRLFIQSKLDASASSRRRRNTQLLDLLLRKAGVQKLLLYFVCLQSVQGHLICRFFGKTAVLCLLFHLIQESFLVDILQEGFIVHCLGNKQAHKVIDILFVNNLVGDRVAFHLGDLAVHCWGFIGQIGEVNRIKGQKVIYLKFRCCSLPHHRQRISVIAVDVYSAILCGQILNLEREGIRHGENLLGIFLVQTFKTEGIAVHSCNTDEGHGIAFVAAFRVVTVSGVCGFIDTDDIVLFQILCRHSKAAGNRFLAFIITQQGSFQHVHCLAADGVFHFLCIFYKDHVRIVLQVVSLILFDDKVHGAEHGVFFRKGQAFSQCQFVGGACLKAVRRIDSKAAVPIGFDLYCHGFGTILGKNFDVCFDIFHIAEFADDLKRNIRRLVVQAE